MKQKEIVLLDSSFLISLAKINGLFILEIFIKHTSVKLLVPYPIYKECVIDGIKYGYTDALFIKKEFEKGVITTREVSCPPKLSVDEMLILLANLWCAKEILVDDELLLKKIVKKKKIIRR